MFGWNFKRKLTSRGANLLAQTLLQPGVSEFRAVRCSRLRVFAGRHVLHAASTIKAQYMPALLQSPPRPAWPAHDHPPPCPPTLPTHPPLCLLPTTLPTHPHMQVSDLTGSFRLFRKPCLEAVMGLCTSKGYAFQMEIAVRARRLGYTIEEVRRDGRECVSGWGREGGREGRSAL